MVKITNKNLSINDVLLISRYKAKIVISQSIIKTVSDNRKILYDMIKQNTPIYGVNRGIGNLLDVAIDNKDLLKFQKNIILSHCAGVGDKLSEEESRAVIVILLFSLSRGYSAVSKDILLFLIELLNLQITPSIPKKGSVGASGDFIPLAHIALIIIGKGKVIRDNKIYETKKILKKYNLSPIKLREKEALSLLNGTHAMAGLAAISIYDAKILLKNAILSSAMTFSALEGDMLEFSEQVLKLKNQCGVTIVGKNLREILKGYNIDGKQHLQDPYTLRCVPQVLGAVYDSLSFIETSIINEINSVTDNPVLIDNKIYSNGNFHGESLAFAMDFLSIAVSEIGSFLERQIFRLLDSTLNRGLPEFLTKKIGINSGYMIAQTTAAALASENKILSHPASVDSVPVNNNQEDHVSMGFTAATKASEIIKNTQYINAIHFLVSAQALDFRKHNFGIGVTSAYAIIRETIKPLRSDRILSTEIEKMRKMAISEKFKNIF